MFPLRDENPHPPGFKPKLTIAFIIVNVIVFFYEVAYGAQMVAARLLRKYGALPSHPTPQISLVTSVMHLGGNMLSVDIDNIEHKFGRSKFFIIYMAWGNIIDCKHKWEPGAIAWSIDFTTFMMLGKCAEHVLVCIPKYSTV